MSKIISIKLTRIGTNIGPFTIYDQHRNIIANNVSAKDLMEGVTYVVNDDVITVTLASTGKCTLEKTVPVTEITKNEYFNTETELVNSSCVWVHMKNPEINHSFYGNTEPYIIEYTFSSPNTEIVQATKDFSKAYIYTKDLHGVSNEPSKIEVDDIYFDEMIIYNNQQCSGLLKLVPKPKNNLKEYNSYPKYNIDSKTITFTKSDNFYKVNNFWDIVKDKTQFIFVRTCEPLSIDKTLHNENMDYSTRSFRKSPLRAKDSRVRLTLNSRSDVHLVSQFIIENTMLSYK